MPVTQGPVLGPSLFWKTTLLPGLSEAEAQRGIPLSHPKQVAVQTAAELKEAEEEPGDRARVWVLLWDRLVPCAAGPRGDPNHGMQGRLEAW